MRSIRFRLIFGSLLVTTLIFTIAGVLLHTAVHRSLLGEFDNSLQAQARSLSAMVEQRGTKLQLEYDPLQMPEFRQTTRPQYFELWSSEGQIVAKSPSLGSDE